LPTQHRFSLGKLPLITQWSYFYKFDVENCMEGAMLGYYNFNVTVNGEILSAP